MSGASVGSDEELISATRSGDEAAFAELYRRHRSVAKGVAVQMGANQDDAEDFVSEAFAATLGKLRLGKGPDVFFRGYILGAVRNLANRHFGKAARLELVAEYEGDAERSVEDDPAARYESEMVRSAFEVLPERARMVLWLTEVEDKKPQEISEMMGLSANAVAALAYRSRETLRQAYLQKHLQKTPDPSCQKYREQLGALMRRNLPAARSRKVQTHVRSCIYCTTALHDISDVNSSLRRVIGPSIVGVGAAGMFPAALGLAPELAASEVPLDDTVPVESEGKRAWWWIAAAGLLLLLIGVGIWLSLQSRELPKAFDSEPPSHLPSASDSPSEPSEPSGTASPPPSASPVTSQPLSPSAPAPPPTQPVVLPPAPPPAAINTLVPSGAFSSDQYDPSSSTLKISLTPTGTGELNNVRVTIALPAGASFDYVDAGPSGWQCAPSGQSVDCSGAVTGSGVSYLRVGMLTGAAGSYPVTISASGTGWGPTSATAVLDRP